MMIDKQELTQAINEFIDGTNLFLVEVKVSPANEIVVTIDSEDSIDIDTCVSLSRHIESKFDREQEEYELEVGSAGLSSPFVVLRQYKKYIGKEVEVLTKAGQKLVGVLKSAEEDEFTVVVTVKEKPEGAKRKVDVEKEYSFKYDEVKYTKYSIRFK